MRGYNLPPEADDDFENLRTWEVLVVNAVGTVIEFWGFKRNQGRVWGLLYLRDSPLSAADIRDELGLSKGAVSMIMRELESWGVIHRVRVKGSQSWHFVAEIDLLHMIRRVFRDREVNVVRRVRQDLDDARLIAQRDDAPDEVVARIERMAQLAGLVEHALSAFLKTARLDMSDVRGIFKDEDHDADLDDTEHADP
jgi:DNA-binding transcriptional regulator GbsR (MarR family)